MADSILEIVMKNSDQRLDTILFADEEYRKLDRVISRRIQYLKKLKLTKRQDQAVDRLLTAYNDESACSCRIFYEQGFKDCISLLKEIGVFG